MICFWAGKENSSLTPLLKEQSLMLISVSCFSTLSHSKLCSSQPPFFFLLLHFTLLNFFFSFFPSPPITFPSLNFSVLLFFNHPPTLFSFNISPVLWDISPSPSLNQYHFSCTALFSTPKMETTGASEILELIYIQASHLKAHNIFSCIMTTSLHLNVCNKNGFQVVIRQN